MHVTSQQVHRILDSARAAAGLPALGAALVTRDDVLLVDAVGGRRAGGTTPVTPGDAVHIGSDARAITAGWIAEQVNAGRLTWETTITEVRPALAEAMRPAYRDVTLLDLLRHPRGLLDDAARCTAPVGGCS